jgi:hypothetical protein
MVTIRRYPVPLDSYNPNGPLNDLMRSQLEHFAHVADRLPPELQVKEPVPSADDAHSAHQFIAAVTEQLMSVKKSPPRLLVKKRASRTQTSNLAIAASAETPKSHRSGPKKKTGSKSRTGSQGK